MALSDIPVDRINATTTDMLQFRIFGDGDSPKPGKPHESFDACTPVSSTKYISVLVLRIVLTSK